jgi:glyoxylase-like metal-dependent hydrolase (beta-lactamase superfamily II)
VRAVHYPACHTDGDTVVFFEEAGAVHLGDLYFSGRFPFVDLDGGGSVDGLIAAIEQIHGQLADDARLIPGHGPLSTKADLGAYLAMLKDCRARVARALEDGQSAEDMKAGELLADYADWSWGFIPTERFIDTLVAAAGR